MASILDEQIAGNVAPKVIQDASENSAGTNLLAGNYRGPGIDGLPVLPGGSVDPKSTTSEDLLAGTNPPGTSGPKTVDPREGVVNRVNPAKVNTLEATQLEDKDTIAGRAAAIMDENSVLMKRTNSIANTRSNQSGGTGGSMGARAAASSVLDKATEMAAKDQAVQARFDELGFTHNAKIATMTEEQQNKFKTMDKEFNIQGQIMDRTEDFQKWMTEANFAQENKVQFMKLFSSLSSTALASMASMSGNVHSSAAEAADFAKSYKNMQDTLQAFLGGNWSTT